METNSKNKSSILLALLCVILVSFLALITLNQNSLRKQLDTTQAKTATLEAEKEELQKDIDQLVENGVQSTGVQGPQAHEELQDLLDIQNTVVDVYREKFRSYLDDRLFDHTTISAFMSQAGLALVQKPKPFDLLSCGQTKRRYFTVLRPHINENRAVVEVKAGEGDIEETIELELVKQGDKWLVDAISCPDIPR
jgi:hypothetical protein